MSDLVQRLREEAERIDGDGGWWEKAPLMREAADRIEQQDAELVELRALVPGNWETTYSSLLCERDELRAALSELRALKARVDGCHPHDVAVTTEDRAFPSATSLLAYLREASDE